MTSWPLEGEVAVDAESPRAPAQVPGAGGAGRVGLERKSCISQVVSICSAGVRTLGVKSHLTPSCLCIHAINSYYVPITLLSSGEIEMKT